MAITYTWDILKIETYPEKDGLIDVVFEVSWFLIGDDGQGHTSTTNGLVNLTLDTSVPYTPFNNLTKEQVVGWVKGSLGTSKVTYYETMVSQEIEKQINPPSVTHAPPWA